MGPFGIGIATFFSLDIFGDDKQSSLKGDHPAMRMGMAADDSALFLALEVFITMNPGYARRPSLWRVKALEKRLAPCCPSIIQLNVPCVTRIMSVKPCQKPCPSHHHFLGGMFTIPMAGLWHWFNHIDPDRKWLRSFTIQGLFITKVQNYPCLRR